MRKLNRSDGWEESTEVYVAFKNKCITIKKTTTKQWKEFNWISWTAMKKVYMCKFSICADKYVCMF